MCFPTPCKAIATAFIALVLLLTACTDPPDLDTIDPSDPYYKALTDPTRSSSDRAKDGTRKPEAILELVGIAPGMRVLDLMAGGGWYTEVLARTVGATGHVVAQNSAISRGRYGEELDRRLENPALPNVEKLTAELDQLELPENSFDAIFMVLFYHDAYWMDVDRAAMNHSILSALRPGGVFLVIDHSAEAGSGARDVKELHRVDEALVRKEIADAGFVLGAESTLLRNAEDARDKIVFSSAIRGNTDRFVLKFVKPD